MEHFSSVRPTGKFPEKVENLKRSPPGPFFSVGISERNFLFHLYVSRSLYQFQVHGWALRRTGVYDQMEHLFTNRKFHFCSHLNFRGFFLMGNARYLRSETKREPDLRLLHFEIICVSFALSSRFISPRFLKIYILKIGENCRGKYKGNRKIKISVF